MSLRVSITDPRIEIESASFDDRQSGKKSRHVQVVPTQGDDFSQQVAGQIVQVSRFFGRDGHYVPACSSKAELDARKMIEVADSEYSWPTMIPISSYQIANRRLSVEPVQIDFHRRRGDSELHGIGEHGFRLVSGSLTGTTGENKPVRKSGLIKINSRSHAICQLTR